MNVLQSLEQSGLMVWVRESGSLLGYPTILFMHTLGLATVAGVSAGLALRLLGFAPGVPLSSMTKFFTLLWVAVVVTVVAGTLLLAADATTKLASPVFYIKLLFIIAALITMVLMRRRVFADPLADTRPLPASARVLSVTALIFWIGATIAGRLMAYIGPVTGLE